MLKAASCAVTVLVLLPIVWSSDIIELACESNADCETFRSTTVNSSCTEDHCQCVELSSGNRTTCTPVVTKASNQVGGQCPCLSDNSYCNEKTQLCVCKEGFLPSRGGKKCISKSVALGKLCEIDEQCISHDHFSHCDDVHHNCTCSNGFAIYQDTCHSVVGSCANDTDCSNRTANSICHEKQCICSKGFVGNAEKSTCLEVASFEKACLDSNQCIAVLGVGSVCIDGKCICNEQHFPFSEHSHNNQTEDRKVCKRKVTHGASCNDDKECYQFHRGPHEQTMECFMNECVCSQGNSESDGICVSQNRAGGLYIHAAPLTLLVIMLVGFFATH